jgi:hypothetical protein
MNIHESVITDCNVADIDIASQLIPDDLRACLESYLKIS